MKDCCFYEGRNVTPEMGGFCNACALYLNTCLPFISGGYLIGAECDAYFCEGCSVACECMVMVSSGREAV